MKKEIILYRLSLLLVALVMTASAWAQGGSGSEPFTIASKADWKTFCDRVADGEITLNAKMTADVDLGTDIVMVGTDIYGYIGTFDGQDHTLSFNWDGGSMNWIAPFRYVDNATIKNLRTQGQITTSGYGLSGLVSSAAIITLSRCVSDVKLTGGNDKRPIEAAGLIRIVGSDGANFTLIDCVVKGSITNLSPITSYAMAGLVRDWPSYCTITNCLYLGTNNAESDEGNYTFGPTGATITNCYYLNACGELQGNHITKAQLRSGEITAKLQAGREDLFWGQTIGTDDEPQPTDKIEKRVYKVEFTYNNKVVATRYANHGGTVSLPTAKELLGTDYNPLNTYTLTFADNFSATTPVTSDKTVAVQMTFITKDHFSIATKDDWKEYCELVESGQALNAKMTADIDLGKDVWIVGSTYSHYTGKFDGQGHTLTVDWTVSGYDQGYPFRILGTGATIKNLHVKGKIMSEHGPIAGLAGVIEGNVTFSGCVSDVELINKDNASHSLSGMVRWIHDGKVTFNDCVVKGTLNATTENGKKEMGGFVGQQDGTCELNNCLYAGTSNAGADSYTFALGAKATNCYYLNACGKAQGQQITAEQIVNGAVAWTLQNGRSDIAWGQVIGTDAQPLPTDEATKRVHKVEFTYNDKVVAARYANTGKTVKLPTAQEILGAAYNTQYIYTLTFDGGFSETTAITGDMKVNVTVTITTGIDDVTAGMKNGAVYDLQGRRVANRLDDATLGHLPSGVYIVNGKKIIVK